MPKKSSQQQRKPRQGKTQRQQQKNSPTLPHTNGGTSRSLPASAGWALSSPVGPPPGGLIPREINNVEYLGDFKREGSKDLTPSVGTYSCTPFQMEWLWQATKCYAYWRPLSWQVIYLPDVGTSVNGSVQMAFLYDYADRTPTSTGQISQCQGFTTSPVWAGSEGAEIVARLRNQHPKAVVARMDCRRRDWLRVKPRHPTATDDTDTVNTWLPARFVWRSSVAKPDGEGDIPGQFYCLYRIQVKDPISPSQQG